MWDRPKLTLTEQHKETLRTLTVDETGPGTVLHDLTALLTFVCEQDLPVSKTHRLPPLKLLPQINALLSHPIEVRLKRPQLKSFPHIQGLYLLLRATGLGQVAGTASKPVLVIHRDVHTTWLSLNPTEQYFTLLEAWLLRGRPEIVGERDSPFGFPLRQFADASGLLSRARSSGLQIAGNGEAEWFWYYTPGRMGIALLEMFGLLTVIPLPPQEGEGWVVDRVTCTPLGEAMFALLSDGLYADMDRVFELVDTPHVSFGVFQPILSPYVPQWQRSLTVPDWTFRAGRYVFRAALGRGLWRSIAIDGESTLDQLAGAILNAYEFDHDHLYQFSYRDPFGGRQVINHPYMDEGPWASETRVGDVPLPVGQAMTYLFDFGDSWEFEITLEQVDPAGKTPRKPVLLDGRGDAPQQYPIWDESR